MAVYPRPQLHRHQHPWTTRSPGNAGTGFEFDFALLWRPSLDGGQTPCTRVDDTFLGLEAFDPVVVVVLPPGPISWTWLALKYWQPNRIRCRLRLTMVSLAVPPLVSYKPFSSLWTLMIETEGERKNPSTLGTQMMPHEDTPYRTCVCWN